jgi:hypothetical protein
MIEQKVNIDQLSIHTIRTLSIDVGLHQWLMHFGQNL